MPVAWFARFLIPTPAAAPPPPFMPSPSPGPGQALSNRERPPHRPALPYPVPPLRSSPACQSACPEPAEGARPEPCRRNLSRARRGKRPAALAGPETPPTRPPKNRQSSRPPARLPLWGSRAGGREYPNNPHRNHRRLPLPCRSKTCPGRDPGPALSPAPACTPTAPHASFRRPRSACPELAEGACPEPAEGESRRHPPPKNPAKMHPAPPQEFFGKNSYARKTTPKSPPSHPTDPSPRLSASAAQT